MRKTELKKELKNFLIMKDKEYLKQLIPGMGQEMYKMRSVILSIL